MNLLKMAIAAELVPDDDLKRAEEHAERAKEGMSKPNLCKEHGGTETMDRVGSWCGACSAKESVVMDALFRRAVSQHGAFGACVLILLKSIANRPTPSSPTSDMIGNAVAEAMGYRSPR